MADLICRTLRDGALEGEHAPALTIKDSIASSFGLDVFTHVLSQISSYILDGKSQSRGLVLIAFSRSPLYYVNLLKRRGIDVTSSHKWFQILDCYTDPLGWKDELGTGNGVSHEASLIASCCKNVKDVDKLFSTIIELGKGLVGQGKVRFCAAIDSVDEMLRHASMSSVAGLLSNLRSHYQVSSTFWLLHSDLHEEGVISAFDYMSSIVASVEPLNQYANFQMHNLKDLSLLDENSSKGRFHVRFKRRNGRVRVMFEEFNVKDSGINFASISAEEGIISQGLVPKVQFNLELSEKERIDRAKVVLPFEHQGNGKPIQIYDGRASLTDNRVEALPVSNTKSQTNESKGEIIYFRDSDDEMPDSDEDPDDDLDI